MAHPEALNDTPDVVRTGQPQVRNPTTPGDLPLADAVKAKRLAANPAKGVENLPRKTARRHVYLSAEDVHGLADEVGQHRALVLVLAYSGCGGVKRSPCACVMSSSFVDGYLYLKTQYSSA